MNKFVLILVLLAGLAKAETPMRIVSSGGSITEIIYALGKDKLIVATDSTSMYPYAASGLPKLGYFRQLSTEGVLSFQPSHLIGAQATGPNTLAKQLEAAGVSVSILGEQRDFAGLKQLIHQVAVLVDAEKEAKVLVDDIEQQVKQVKAKHGLSRPIKALFVLSDSERGLTVAGNNTVPQALFNDAGLHNVAAEMVDYKVMDNESILAANPDLIFVASHRVKSPEALQLLCQHPALKMTSAGINCSPVLMESSNALGLSPRYPEALKKIMESAEAINAS